MAGSPEFHSEELSSGQEPFVPSPQEFLQEPPRPPVAKRREFRTIEGGLEHLGDLLDKTRERGGEEALQDQQYQERFQRVFRGGFGEVIPGNFKITEGLERAAKESLRATGSRSSGRIESINIFPPRGANGEVNSLNITVWYSVEGQEEPLHADVVLGKNGELGVVPLEVARLGITKQNLRTEILDVLEALNTDFYTMVPDELLPPGELLEERATGVGEGREKASVETVDLRRLDLARNREDALFGFVGMKKGFAGYVATVLKSGVLVLSNPTMHNAAYLFDLGAEIPIDESAVYLRPGETMTTERSQGIEEERQRIIRERCGVVMSGLDKAKARDLGATRMKHPDSDLEDQEWKQRGQKLLDKKIQHLIDKRISAQ